MDNVYLRQTSSWLAVDWYPTGDASWRYTAMKALDADHANLLNARINAPWPAGFVKLETANDYINRLQVIIDVAEQLNMIVQEPMDLQKTYRLKVMSDQKIIVKRAR